MAVAAAAADGRLLHLPDAAGEGYDADIDRSRRTAASARAQILPAAPAVRSEMPGDGAADRGAGPPAKHIEKHQQFQVYRLTRGTNALRIVVGILIIYLLWIEIGRAHV